MGEREPPRFAACGHRGAGPGGARSRHPGAGDRWRDPGARRRLSRGRCRGLRRDQTLRMIALQINGRRVELDQPTGLLAYLETLGVSARAVAVEHNGVIIERSRYAEAKLEDGDVVEIVRMVGGGCQRRGALSLIA